MYTISMDETRRVEKGADLGRKVVGDADRSWIHPIGSGEERSTYMRIMGCSRCHVEGWQGGRSK